MVLSLKSEIEIANASTESWPQRARLANYATVFNDSDFNFVRGITLTGDE